MVWPRIFCSGIPGQLKVLSQAVEDAETGLYLSVVTDAVFCSVAEHHTIPALAKIRAELQDGIPTDLPLKELKKLNEPSFWSEELNAAWQVLITTIQEASEQWMEYYDPSKPICMFSDASDRFWGLMIV